MNLFNEPSIDDQDVIKLNYHLQPLIKMHEELQRVQNKIIQDVRNGAINRFSTLGYKYFEAYQQINFKQISENNESFDCSQVHLDVDNHFNKGDTKTQASSEDYSLSPCSTQNKIVKRTARKTVFSDCESTPVKSSSVTKSVDFEKVQNDALMQQLTTMIIEKEIEKNAAVEYDCPSMDQIEPAQKFYESAQKYQSLQESHQQNMQNLSHLDQEISKYIQEAVPVSPLPMDAPLQEPIQLKKRVHHNKDMPLNFERPRDKDADVQLLKQSFRDIFGNYQPDQYYHTNYFNLLLRKLKEQYQSVLKSNIGHRAFLFQFLLVLLKKPQCEICNAGVNVDPDSSLYHQRHQNKHLHNKKHRDGFQNNPIHHWYAFPQMEGPDDIKTEESPRIDNKFGKAQILFICPVFPCNGKGSCNYQRVKNTPPVIFDQNYTFKKIQHENNVKRMEKTRKHYSFGYDRPDLQIHELGFDYVTNRYVPLFLGYRDILLHMVQNHTPTQLEPWGWSHQFMQVLLWEYYQIK